MAKNRTFFRSEEQAAFLGIQTNSVGQKTSNRHQHSLHYPQASLMSSDAGKHFVSLFHPLCRIESEATSLLPHFAPWESVAALQRDFKQKQKKKEIKRGNVSWTKSDAIQSTSLILPSLCTIINSGIFSKVYSFYFLFENMQHFTWLYAWELHIIVILSIIVNKIVYNCETMFS